MPSFQQVQAHNQMVEEAKAAEAARQAEQEAARQAQAQSQMGLQAKYTQDRDFLLNHYNQQAAAQQAGYQQQRDATQFQQQAAMQHQGTIFQGQLNQQQAELRHNENIQQTDLAAQLNQVKLTQSEEMETHRTREAIAAVNRNPDLAPDERRALITQLETKLNPLENRQRDAMTLETQMRTQAMQQQAEQSATLFSQHQAQIARGIQGNIQYADVTGPDGNTYRQAYYVDSRGNIQEMNFPMMQQSHDMRMAQGAVGITGELQTQQQRASLFPGQMQLQAHQIRHAGLTNDVLAEEVAHLPLLHPLQRESLRTEIRHRLTTIAGQMQEQEIRGEMRDPELARAYRQLTLMDSQITNLGATTAHTNEQTSTLRFANTPEYRETSNNLRLAELDLARARATHVGNENAPEVLAAQQQYRVAHARLINAQADHAEEERAWTPQIATRAFQSASSAVGHELQGFTAPPRALRPNEQAPPPPTWMAQSPGLMDVITQLRNPEFTGEGRRTLEAQYGRMVELARDAEIRRRVDTQRANLVDQIRSRRPQSGAPTVTPAGGGVASPNAGGVGGVPPRGFEPGGFRPGGAQPFGGTNAAPGLGFGQPPSQPQQPAQPQQPGGIRYFDPAQGGQAPAQPQLTPQQQMMQDFGVQNAPRGPGEHAAPAAASLETARDALATAYNAFPATERPFAGFAGRYLGGQLHVRAMGEAHDILDRAIRENRGLTADERRRYHVLIRSAHLGSATPAEFRLPE